MIFKWWLMYYCFLKPKQKLELVYSSNVHWKAYSHSLGIFVAPIFTLPRYIWIQLKNIEAFWSSLRSISLAMEITILANDKTLFSSEIGVYVQPSLCSENFNLLKCVTLLSPIWIVYLTHFEIAPWETCLQFESLLGFLKVVWVRAWSVCDSASVVIFSTVCVHFV